MIGFQPATRSPKVSATQSTWRLHSRRPCLSSRKPWRSSANQPGQREVVEAHPDRQAGVAAGLEDRAVALDLLLGVLPLLGLEPVPVERQPVVGEPVLGVEREVLGVPGGEPVPVTGARRPSRLLPRVPVAARRRALGLRRRGPRPPDEPLRPVAHRPEPVTTRQSSALRLVVGLVADHVELLVELDVDLGAVVEGDLDLVVALLVADLGLGDPALAGVLEGGGRGLVEGRAR